MSDEVNDVNSDCQLCGIYECGTNLTRTDEAAIFRLRLISALKRRIKRLSIKIGSDTATVVNIGSNPELSPPKANFSEGERVRIRSVAEIKGSLDEKASLNGLVFLKPMEEYCGGEFTIVKKVRRIYDEREERMVRLRDAYILDGVICKGRNVFAKEGCDRCCPFFWRSGWLERM